MTATSPPRSPTKSAEAKAAPPNVDEMLKAAFAMHQDGRVGEAATAYKKILKIAPDNVDAVHLMGLALRAYGRHEQAEAMFRKTIALIPGFADAHYNLGNTFFTQGKFAEAIGAYEKATELQPDNGVAHFNLGNACRAIGDMPRAVAAFSRAVAIDKKSVRAWHNLANALKDSGMLKEAADCYRATLKLSPQLAEAHYNLGLLLLLAGDLKRGFEYYEWRHKVYGLGCGARNFKQPKWGGAPVQGKTVLVHAEPNFGDSIHFARYLPKLAAEGARVVVECQAPLVEFFHEIDGVASVVEKGAKLPEFDLHCPIPSLPRAFGTTRETIPADVPYFKPNPLAIRDWRQRLEQDGKFFRIGLVWTGNPAFGAEAQRSLSIKHLLGLPQLPNLRYYNLQSGAAEKDLTDTGLDKIIPNLAPGIEDFQDLAAAISSLDLLISIDAAPAHLAGALGKTVWLVLPALADWRWGRQARSTPWYPSMRLYRQTLGADIGEVFKQMGADLLKSQKK